MSEQYNFNLMLNELHRTLYRLDEGEFISFYDNLVNAYNKLVDYRKEFTGSIESESIELFKKIKSPWHFFNRNRLERLLIEKKQELKEIKEYLSVSLKDEFLTLQLLEITNITASERGIDIKV